MVAAQSFKSADELKISEAQKDALIKTLVLFETGKVCHAKIGLGFYYNAGDVFTGHFNMCHWNSAVHGCETVSCIGGTAELIGGVTFGKMLLSYNHALYQLFMPNLNLNDWDAITPTQAARAICSYLTTGDAKWAEAIA
jgi:hypothetical protein